MRTEDPLEPGGASPAPDRRAAAPIPPEGDPTVQREHSAQVALIAASKFVGRLAQLEFTALGRAVNAWHRMMGSVTDDWFAAERGVATAISATQRHAEQELLLSHLGQIFRRANWFKPGRPGSRVGATEASGQYVATLAMLALLVRDRIAPRELETLYAPFVELIPLESLEPE